MDNKIKLKVLGLSYSQAQTGAYALILSNENDNKRIPVVIGAAEAQSIAIIMEKMVTPRPLTHDLFTSFCEGFAISVVEVYIYRLEEGIFYSEILCKNDKISLKIDARTSDAVAIALRADCPLFTSSEILEKAGISITDKELSSSRLGEDAPMKSSEDDTAHVDKMKDSSTESSESIFEGYSISQLKSMLEESILNEDYERASLLRDEISKRE
jgi:bifunctional DNase/RNase